MFRAVIDRLLPALAAWLWGQERARRKEAERALDEYVETRERIDGADLDVHPDEWLRRRVAQRAREKSRAERLGIMRWLGRPR